jgi:peptidoglycan hydrolase-like protein with peptidoglycan-binding domain
MRGQRGAAAYIFPLDPLKRKRSHTMFRKIAIAALTLSSVGAIAAANDTSANTQSSSNQSYSSSQSLGASSSVGDAQVTQIQQSLNAMGLNAGPVDGKMGPRTQAALRQFQQQKGLQASGQADQQTLAALSTGSMSAGTQTSSQSSFSPQGSSSSQSAAIGSTSDSPGTAPASTGASTPNSPTTGTNGSTPSYSQPGSQQPSSTPK